MEQNGCIIWIVSLILSIASGIAAWNMIEPESFLGAVVFIVLWGILFKVITVIVTGIVTAIVDN